MNVLLIILGFFSFIVILAVIHFNIVEGLRTKVRELTYANTGLERKNKELLNMLEDKDNACQALRSQLESLSNEAVAPGQSDES